MIDSDISFILLLQKFSVNIYIQYKKNVLNLFFIIDIFLFFSNRKFYFCDGKSIRAHKSPINCIFFLKICTVVRGNF